MELASDFLVSPRCFQLYSVALKASQSPVPDDWKEQLEEAVRELPEEATVHELIKVVAALSPDRARTLIQVLEEEVSVMEDVVDHEALERIKRLRREQQSELKGLASTAKQARMAALEVHRQLMDLLPTFNWDCYHADPNYLQCLLCERMQRKVLQHQMEYGCQLDLEEELCKARRENQLLRDHYNYLCCL